MKPYKIVVAYDGTAYHGWQEQADQATVAGTLQHVFKKVFGHEIKTVGASRTDAGVHAHAQVARFYTDLSINCELMLRSWNGALPQDISLLSLEHSPKGFHPQHNIKRKIYRYYISPSRPLPLVARYVHFCPYTMSWDIFKQALSLFIGEHDFNAFCTGECSKGTVCRVDSITVTFDQKFNAYCVEVIGTRFLHHMIRRIVGAALKVATSQDVNKEMIADALQSRVSNPRLPTAPARGLHLYAIEYQF